MTNRSAPPLQRDWSVSPGEILADELESRGMAQAELARRMGRPTKTINEIVNAKAAITPDTALQLELALEIPARLWLSLEASYREHLARSRAVLAFEDDADWLRGFPLADLKRHKLVSGELRGGELVAALLAFFGVSSVDSWTRLWSDPVADYRHSPSFNSEPAALAAWLRWGERFAASVDTAPFDAVKLLDVLKQARGFTAEEPLSDVLEELGEMLADCGVVLALTPGFKGTAVSGVARWLSPHKALIQLSMRYRSDDHLWFTFFHECSHLLDGSRDGHLESERADGPIDELERRVDERARDLLIPRAEYEAFVARGDFEVTTVRSFAHEIDVAPGVVAGRLERDEHVKRGRLASLKKSVSWQG